MLDISKSYTPKQIAAIMIYLAAKKILADRIAADGWESTDIKHEKEHAGVRVAITNMNKAGIPSDDVTDIIANWEKFYAVLVERKPLA